MARRSSRGTRFVPVRASSAEPRTGSVVRVTFGNRESLGTVVGRTITGRYNVKIDVVGADEPVTASFAREQLQLPAS